jgi:hypothetical protein
MTESYLSARDLQKRLGISLSRAYEVLAQMPRVKFGSVACGYPKPFNLWLVEHTVQPCGNSKDKRDGIYDRGETAGSGSSTTASGSVSKRKIGRKRSKPRKSTSSANFRSGSRCRGTEDDRGGVRRPSARTLRRARTETSRRARRRSKCTNRTSDTSAESSSRTRRSTQIDSEAVDDYIATRRGEHVGKKPRQGPTRKLATSAQTPWTRSSARCGKSSAWASGAAGITCPWSVCCRPRRARATCL